MQWPIIMNQYLHSCKGLFDNSQTSLPRTWSPYHQITRQRRWLDQILPALLRAIWLQCCLPQPFVPSSTIAKWPWRVFLQTHQLALLCSSWESQTLVWELGFLPSSHESWPCFFFPLIVVEPHRNVFSDDTKDYWQHLLIFLPCHSSTSMASHNLWASKDTYIYIAHSR